MVRQLKGIALGDEVSFVELACASTDDKPTTGIATGSVCLEVDTGKLYAFNEKNSTWVEQ